MLASFALRAYYVSYVPIERMQHDGGEPYELLGHLGYITYLLENGFLPDFDVRMANQFWHPPLHYIFSAWLLKLWWALFPGSEGSFEILQLLPLLSVTIAIFVSFRILEMFYEDDRPVLCTLLVYLAFQPIFIFFSGSINNDAPALMWSVSALYFALRWYRTPSLKLILLTALCFGAGLSTKLSVCLMAAPVTVLFLSRFFRKPKQYLSQFGAFLCVSVPAGLWWYVRNYLLYRVPFNFIWDVQNGHELIGYVGDIPLIRRFTDFNPEKFFYINTYVQYSGSHRDVNPLAVLIKSAANELWSWSFQDGAVKKLSYHVLLCTLCLSIAAIPALAVFAAGKGRVKADRTERTAVLTLIAVMLASFYTFTVKYPYVWSMDVRYVTPLLLAAALCFGSMMTANRKARYGMYFLIALFAASEIMFILWARSVF